jgi:ABC-type lipoprotein export system ATPase subunit
MVTHEAAAASYADRTVRFLDGKVESDIGNGGGH